MDYITRKFYTLITLIISFLAVIVRSVELFLNLDENAVFYLNEKSVGRIILIVLIALAFVFGLWYGFSLYLRRRFSRDPKFRLQYFFCDRITLIIVSLGFAVDVFFEIYRLSNPIYDIALPYNSAFFSLIIVLLTIACLALFLALTLIPDNKNISVSIYWIVPVIWAVLRTIRDFVSFPVITPISKNSLDIIYLCALIMTTFSISRIFTSSEARKGYGLFTVFAPVTIVLGFVLSLPPIFALIFSFKSANTTDVYMHIVDLTFSIFLISISDFIHTRRSHS